jgi:hypothetical protein
MHFPNIILVLTDTAEPYWDLSVLCSLPYKEMVAPLHISDWSQVKKSCWVGLSCHWSLAEVGH